MKHSRFVAGEDRDEVSNGSIKMNYGTMFSACGILLGVLTGRYLSII